VRIKKIKVNKEVLETFVIVVLSGVLIAGYYQFIFLPKKEAAVLEQQKIEQEVRKTEECLSNSEAIKGRLEEENEEFLKVGMDYANLSLDGVYYFKSKDRCVYSMKLNLTGELADQSSYFIRDALTDKRLYKFFVDRQKEEYEAFLAGVMKD